MIGDRAYCSRCSREDAFTHEMRTSGLCTACRRRIDDARDEDVQKALDREERDHARDDV